MNVVAQRLKCCDPYNYVNPEDLTIIQRTALKEAFKTIDKL